MSERAKIAVLGAGAWGTALAAMACRAGCQTTLYARSAAVASAIHHGHRHPSRLGDIDLPPALVASHDLRAALRGAEAIVLVVPAQETRGFLMAHQADFPAGVPVILAAKGLETGSGLRQDEIMREFLPQTPLSVLSGPGFADDIAKGLPTAVTLAADDLELAQTQAKMLSSTSFRIYANQDMIGVQLGGALKNVLALAVGAARGAGLGASAEAALITRGFAEIKRLGMALGGRAETFDGLSGLGDLVLTCGSPQSRNFAYGMALGRGERLEGLPLAEGVKTAHSAAKTAAQKGVSAPIIHATAQLLERKTTIAEAVAALMSRPLNIE